MMCKNCSSSYNVLISCGSRAKDLSCFPKQDIDFGAVEAILLCPLYIQIARLHLFISREILVHGLLLPVLQISSNHRPLNV